MKNKNKIIFYFIFKLILDIFTIINLKLFLKY